MDELPPGVIKKRHASVGAGGNRIHCGTFSGTASWATDGLKVLAAKPRSNVDPA
jgi:hypothetical protein